MLLGVAEGGPFAQKRLLCWGLLELIPLFSVKSIPEAPRACNAETVPCFRVGCGCTCMSRRRSDAPFLRGVRLRGAPHATWRLEGATSGPGVAVQGLKV